MDPQASEAAWLLKLQAGKAGVHIRRALKKEVYGTERPSLVIETARATEAAARLASDFSLIQSLFPNGFGLFARDVRGW